MQGISDQDLQAAFDGFVARLKGQTALQGEALNAYLRQLRDTFLDYRARLSASIECTDRFVLVRSICAYVGYPGDNQVRIEHPADVADEVLGQALSQAMQGSRTMMRDFLSGAQAPIEREEGMRRHKAHVDALCQRHGYRSGRALYKALRLVHAELNLDRGSIVVTPTDRYAAEGYVGLDDALCIRLPKGCAAIELGAAARLAMGRCTDSYGK